MLTVCSFAEFGGKVQPLSDSMRSKAQLIAKRDGKIYLEQIKGIPTEIAVDGKVLKNVKAKGIAKPVYKNIYLVDSKTAEHLFLQEEGKSMMSLAPSFKKIKEAESVRKITMGVQKVAEEPSDADFKKAAVYQLNLSPQTAHSSWQTTAAIAHSY